MDCADESERSGCPAWKTLGKLLRQVQNQGDFWYRVDHTAQSVVLMESTMAQSGKMLRKRSRLLTIHGICGIKMEKKAFERVEK